MLGGLGLPSGLVPEAALPSEQIFRQAESQRLQPELWGCTCNRPGGLTDWVSYHKMPAAAAAKSLQSCPTLRDPMACSLPGSAIHGISKARVLEWVAIAFSNKMPESPSISPSDRTRV